MTDAYAHEGHGRDQLRKHSKVLHDPEALLFVITPDPARPTWFGELDGLADEEFRERVLWLSFRDLAEAIGKLIADPARVSVSRPASCSLSWRRCTRQTACCQPTTQLWSPPARGGRNTSDARHTSASPTGRSAPALKYFGFYAEGVIQPVIPLIRHHAAVPFTRDEAHARLASGDARLATLISDLLDEESRTEGEAYDVLLLTGIDDPRTIRLQAPVANNTVTGSGKPLGMDPEPALHQPGQAHQRGHPHQRTLTGPLPAYCTAHPAGSLTQNIKICFISALARVQTRTGEYHGASLQLNDAS